MAPEGSSSAADEQELIRLYQEIAELTRSKCRTGKQSSIPEKPWCGFCCDGGFCEEAIRHAKEAWGVELQRTGDVLLPLLGASGCTAAPHLRPICSVHQCGISSLGFFRGDRKTTNRYFKLRDRISELELRRDRIDVETQDLLGDIPNPADLA